MNSQAVHNLYSTIDMPMRVFMNALEGDKSEVDPIAFDDVLNEFFETVGGRELIRELEDMKQEAMLSAKITMARSLINLINEKSHLTPECFEQLKELNYHINLPHANLEDPETYCKQIEGWVKLDIVNLLELQQPEKGKKKKSANLDRNFFADKFLEISSVLKFPFDENMSCRMFCRAMIKIKTQPTQ